MKTTTSKIEKIKKKLSREEMKTIMAGSADPGGCGTCTNDAGTKYSCYKSEKNGCYNANCECGV